MKKAYNHPFYAHCEPRGPTSSSKISGLLLVDSFFFEKRSGELSQKPESRFFLGILFSHTEKSEVFFGEKMKFVAMFVESAPFGALFGFGD